MHHDGWRSVSPRATGYWLVWREGSSLRGSATDFRQTQTLGRVGPVDCPIAVDRKRNCCYRYACADIELDRDYSEVRGFTPGNAVVERLFSLDTGKWMLWLCDYLPKRDVIVGLVSSSRPIKGVHIQHQLGFFDMADRRSLLVPLPADAFVPQALSHRSEQVLFHGANGYQLLDFKGRRVAHLSGRGITDGRGGDFHPSLDVIALGGRKVLLWNLSEGRFQTIHECGLSPRWSRDGKRLYFRQSSSDLYWWDLESGQSQCCFSVAGVKFPEIYYATQPMLSPCGRYMALNLSRRVRRSLASSGAAEVHFNDRHSLAIADLEEKVVWQHPVETRNVAWL